MPEKTVAVDLRAGASETRTRPRKREMVEAIQADLQDAASRLDGLLAFLAELEKDARGVNGLQGRCRSWCQGLEQMASGLREESKDVAAKLLGEGPKIESSVDPSAAERVARAKVGEAG